MKLFSFDDLSWIVSYSIPDLIGTGKRLKWLDYFSLALQISKKILDPKSSFKVKYLLKEPDVKVFNKLLDELKLSL